MKCRFGFVSNSSSSNFILKCENIKKHLDMWCYFPRSIYLNAFSCLIKNLKDMDKYPTKIKINDMWIFSVPTAEYVNEEKDTVFISFDGLDETELFHLLCWLVIRCDEITFHTGGTSSDTEPQVFLQSTLLDLNIPYEIEGDGSLDVRDKDVVEELMADYPVGPVSKILKEQVTKLKGDTSVSS
jgi:hypothetical protein